MEQVRRYNFDDNVREDLYPLEIGHPKCDKCNTRVDTTEETTRTLMLRRMAGQKPLCARHGGVFGGVSPGAGCNQQ